jgi:hypothetical protein
VADTGQRLGGWKSFDVELGDLDGDGDLDAYFCNCRQPDLIWINDGLGKFKRGRQSLGDFSSSSVALADMDRDGDLDAVVTCNDQPNVLWENDGTGVFRHVELPPRKSESRSWNQKRTLGREASASVQVKITYFLQGRPRIDSGSCSCSRTRHRERGPARRQAER